MKATYTLLLPLLVLLLALLGACGAERNENGYETEVSAPFEYVLIPIAAPERTPMPVIAESYVPAEPVIPWYVTLGVDLHTHVPDTEGIGRTFFGLGGGRLPMWLCAGLELYWMDKHDMPIPDGIDRNMDTGDWLPDFGEAWFIPGLLADETPWQVLSEAYAFVWYISEMGALEGLVASYLRESRISAEEMYAALRADFSGIADEGWVFQYEQGAVHHVEGSPGSPFEIDFHLWGDAARYLFGNRAGEPRAAWTYGMVSHYAAIGEESLSFVQEWLGVSLTQRWSVYFIHEDEVIGGGYGNRILTNFQHHTDPPWSMAHEAVHAVLAAANIRTNFPPTLIDFGPGFTLSQSHFEEGMCVLIELLFEIETQNERFARETAQKRTGNQNAVRMTLDDTLRYVNRYAIWFTDWFLGADDIGNFHPEWGMLQSYHSAASFLFYLYTERGTREDLLRAYRNIHHMYDIYGADIDELISDWLKWLEAWR
ncbi:MAG: hypothetical protein FWD90_05170 [Defluviitaleaceae bacterium]|nr:hypothetical protein [Defluviitaleaceae bacterium]